MSGRIPRQFIDDVIARTDIVEIIDQRVRLKKAGKNYQACCPFHNEKSPSFTVSQEKQFYHCFGCGAHGNAISFLMDYENLEFVDAIEELADFHHLEVPREQTKGGTKQPNRAQQQSDYELMEAATQLYRQQLKSHANKDSVIEYLKGRNLSGETVRAFHIGYAPPEWDTLYKQFGTNQSQRAQLNDLKLTNQSDNGRQYDFFRDRIMFPIRDKRGRVIGFGGRVMGDGSPKYLNSPETRIFHKGRELYGLYEAKQASAKIEQILIVEGYMDVVALAQHNINYAVASLGTSTTPEHIQTLFRTTTKVICCYDGDRAGRDAAWRALENALPYLKDGVELKFLFLPDGEDPDSLVNKEGKEAFESRYVDAQTLTDFFFEKLHQQVDATSDAGKAAFVAKAKPLLDKIPSDFYRESIMNKLAMTVNRTAEELSRYFEKPQQTLKPQESFKVTPMRRAVGLLLQYPTLANAIPFKPALRKVDIPGFALLIDIQESILQQPNTTTASLIEKWREKPEGNYLNQLAIWQHNIDEEMIENEFVDTFHHLENMYLQKTYDSLLLKQKTQGLSKEEYLIVNSLLAALKSSKKDPTLTD
ncbi:DNA primase [Flocculibacter collagenilyticus]|uniref:DNA primase n=1 Tax=Flocculibacter collagenilyticus TaxID=2744479 RepID=UPI0018F2CCAE|nr:DNA primase [Flocculibacter collagenilyticus]